MAKTYGTGDDTQEKAEETDDIAGRFPDLETDERLKTPRGQQLPEPPRREFVPPTLPQVQILRDERTGVAGSGMGKDELRGAGLASAAGIQLFVAIAVCTGLGYLIDRFVLKSGGTPWGLIVGFFVGAGSGFLNLFRLTAQLDREDGGDGGGSNGGK